MPDALLDWWTLVTAEIGVAMMLFLLLYLALTYLAAVGWLLWSIGAELVHEVRRERRVTRDLRALHLGAYREQHGRREGGDDVA